jgi:transcriptional regulator with XRE-family HTH domain
MNSKTDEQKEQQMTVFAPRMKAIRVALDLSQKEFSTAIGVSQATISMYENGAVGPNLTTIQKIVERYPKINPLYLLGESEEMYSNESQNITIVNSLSELEKGNTDLDSVPEEFFLNKEQFEEILSLIKTPANPRKSKQQEFGELTIQNQLLEFRLREKEIQIIYLNTLVQNLQQQNEDLRKIAKLQNS